MFSDFGDSYRIYRACELVFWDFIFQLCLINKKCAYFSSHFSAISFTLHSTIVFTFYSTKQARKLGRCDSYLRNLKTLPTHSLTHRPGQVLGDAIASKNTTYLLHHGVVYYLPHALTYSQGNFRTCQKVYLKLGLWRPHWKYIRKKDKKHHKKK